MNKFYDFQKNILITATLPVVVILYHRPQSEIEGVNI